MQEQLQNITNGVKDYKGPERRQLRRKPTSLTGCIVYGANNLKVECVIRNFSEDGARVSIATSQALPDSVTLLEPSSFMAYEATVIWRCGGLLGLSFDRAVSVDNDEIVRLYLLRQIAFDFRERSTEEAANLL